MTISDPLRDQYECFPYPSVPDDGRGYPELANLMKLFERDCGYTFKHKRVLDAGTGTGLRLLELAKFFPDNEYLGIDYSEKSISCALAAQGAFPDARVAFVTGDLNMTEPGGGPFDLIFCMGVLHHLENPRRLLERLGRLLADRGMIFFYVYGEYGSGERMRRKRLLKHLHGDGNIREKIESAKQLGFTDFPYGWEVRNQADIDGMIVDAYINHYEVLYTLETIGRIIPSNLAAWVPYGFTLERNGVLVESRLDPGFKLPLPRTNPKQKLASSALEATYKRLSKRSQLLLLEDWYAPSNYTILAHKGAFTSELQRPDRLTENTWR
jgi:SAM-dependent methyltransferase